VTIYRFQYTDPSLRQSVYDYDGYRCRHCGTGERLTLDHIIPRVLNGPDTFDNLQTLCQPCNSRKGCAPYVMPQMPKQPKVPVPIPAGWRIDVPKAVLAPKPTAQTRRGKKLQRRRYWAMMMKKHPTIFTHDQPMYAPKERLRIAALRPMVESVTVLQSL